MHVISKKALTDCATTHADAGTALNDWWRIAKSATWQSLADVKKTYPHADYYNPYTIFNIKGNTYRLIVKIEYQRQQIYIRAVLTHAEYDKDKWK